MSELTIDSHTMAMLAQTIQLAIEDGLKSTRRSVTFQKYEEEDYEAKDGRGIIVIKQRMAYTEMKYSGTFLQFVSADIKDEIELMAVVEQLDGTVHLVGLDRMKFDVDFA